MPLGFYFLCFTILTDNSKNIVTATLDSNGNEKKNNLKNLSHLNKLRVPGDCFIKLFTVVITFLL
jgi:hypothetical protein